MQGKSTALFQDIFAELSLPILLVDDSYLLQKLNAYALKVLQLEPDSIGCDTRAIMPWISGLLQPISGGHKDFERLIMTDEGERYSSIRVSALRLQGSKFFLITLHDLTEVKQVQKELIYSQNRLRDFIEFLPDPTFGINLQGQVIIWNRAMEKLTGVPKQDILNATDFSHSLPFWGQRRPSLADLLLDANLHAKYDNYHNQQQDKDALYAECFVPALNAGKGAHLWLKASPLYDQKGIIVGAIESVRDLTEQKKGYQALLASEQRLRHITDNLLDIVMEMDSKANISYVSPSCLQVLGYSPEQLLGRYALGFIHREDRVVLEMAFNNIEAAPNNRFRSRDQFRCLKADGNYIWVEASTNFIFNEKGELQQSLLALRDISRRKQLLAEIAFMNWHDSLTGLYGRNYWHEKLSELEEERLAPVGLLLCDVDGLKLINDTMGYETGDQLLRTVAGLLRMVSTPYPSAITARIGGDEFAILLPHEGRQAALDISDSLRKVVAQFNASRQGILPLSISIGIAYRNQAHDKMLALIKRADDRMYREKLNRSQSVRYSLVQTLTSALEARDFGTEGHTMRVEQLAILLGERLNLPSPNLNDLRLLARFHDLGKVGTPDAILYKPGPLTAAERKEMQRHAEIGHRIALAAPDLVPIADLILKHHEWWNGSGYPLKLKGNAIPLACRILSIVDAYDAMTSDRPYRKAIPREAALAELEVCAGSQFDPQLTPIFVNLIKEYPDSN